MSSHHYYHAQRFSSSLLMLSILLDTPSSGFSGSSGRKTHRFTFAQELGFLSNLQLLLCSFLPPPLTIGVKRCITVLWICISLVGSDVEHFLVCVLASCTSSWGECVFEWSAFFSFMSCWELNPEPCPIQGRHSDTKLYLQLLPIFELGFCCWRVYYIF
jgi:hypothetical protein